MRNIDNHFVSAELPLRRVQLEMKKFAAQHLIHTDLQFRLDNYMDQAARAMVLQLQARVASKKYEVKTVRWPDGPWQFIKFYVKDSPLMGLGVVRWFLRQWPVKFIEVTMEANAYYPDVCIPDHDAFVEIMVRTDMDAR